MKFWQFRFMAVFFSMSLICFFSSGYALACASCGSGGDEPLVLFPAETFKIYGGVAVTPQFESTGPDGLTLQTAGPNRRVNSTVAAGIALSPRGFFTVAQTVVTNSRTRTNNSDARKSSASKSGAADPSFSGRYTVMMLQLSRPLIPQIQILGGYRPALARSIHDSSDANLLDVFGSGFDEVRVGADLWLGMLSVKTGVAMTLTESIAARRSGILLKPGTLVRLTTSLTMLSTVDHFGINVQLVKLAAGVTADRRTRAAADRELVDGSEQSVNGAFISADLAALESDSVKFTVARQGVFGVVKNAVASTTWSLAWARVLR